MTADQPDQSDDAEARVDNSEKPIQTRENTISDETGNNASPPNSQSLTMRISDGVSTRLPVTTRVIIQRYTTVILAVFVLTAVLGAGGLYFINSSPEVNEQTETIAEWSTAAAFSHSAVVHSGTTVFSIGEQLTDRSLYFTQVSPIIDGEYIISHDGQISDGGGTIDLWLVLRSSEQRTVDGQKQDVTHWEQRKRLRTVDAQPFTSGDVQRVPFSVNTSAVREQLAQIESELGASPGTTEAVVVSDVSFTGVVAGEQLSETRSDEIQIALESNTVTIASDVEPPTTQAVTEVITTSAAPPVLLSYAGTSVIIIGITGSVSFLWLNSIGAFTLSPAERRRREYQRTREEYDQWICRGSVPEIEPQLAIELDTLADATTVAVSNGSVVIEQLQPVHQYVVLKENIIYRFTPPDSTAEQSTK